MKAGIEATTGETVAVKVLERAKAADEAARERLANEMAILRVVDHPNILRLLDVVDHGDATYLVTEYISGGELFGYIVERGHLPEAEAIELFAQIVSAVASFHSRLIIHRDLKPENMLLTQDHREVKVIDFGLGAMLPSAEEVLTLACGSPHYAAPEMLLGEGYDGRKADMWSLGVCLYAMLCGCLPFDEEDMEVLYDKTIAGDYNYNNCPPLSKAAVDLIGCVARSLPVRIACSRPPLTDCIPAQAC